MMLFCDIIHWRCIMYYGVTSTARLRLRTVLLSAEMPQRIRQKRKKTANCRWSAGTWTGSIQSNSRREREAFALFWWRENSCCCLWTWFIALFFHAASHILSVTFPHWSTLQQIQEYRLFIQIYVGQHAVWKCVHFVIEVNSRLLFLKSWGSVGSLLTSETVPSVLCPPSVQTLSWRGASSGAHPTIRPLHEEPSVGQLHVHWRYMWESGGGDRTEQPAVQSKVLTLCAVWTSPLFPPDHQLVKRVTMSRWCWRSHGSPCWTARYSTFHSVGWWGTCSWLRLVLSDESHACECAVWKTWFHLYWPQTQVLFRGQTLYLMTSHFESCKAHAAERMRQLTLVMRKMTRAPDDVTVLFGGDTNLRDAEVLYVLSIQETCQTHLGEKRLFKIKNYFRKTTFQKTQNIRKQQ